MKPSFQQLLVLIVACFWCSAIDVSAAAPSADEGLADKINQLVLQLGDATFAERQAAMEALMEIGEPAREALEAVREGEDLERAWRAGKILKKWDNAAEIAAEKLAMKTLRERGSSIRAAERPEDQQAGKLLIWLNRKNGSATDEDARLAAKIKNVRELHAGFSSLTDEGLRSLTALSELRSLNLSYTLVTNEGLKQLKHFPQLEELALEGLHEGTGRGDGTRRPAITDEVLLVLKDLTELRKLDLSNSRSIRGVGLKELTRLHTLDLGETAVTDRTMAEVKMLENLIHLGLRGTKVTTTGLKELAELPRLDVIEPPGVWLFLRGSTLRAAVEAERRNRAESSSAGKSDETTK